MTKTRQVAALPIRKTEDGSIRVLLVTSRETRRYVIPKGWPWPGHKDHKAAAREAREEAGIIGKPSKKSIGEYTYAKRRPEGSVPVTVKVFLLEVVKELESWPEQHERKRIWLTPTKAAEKVAEPELARIISKLEAA